MREHTKLRAFEPADSTIDYTLAPVVVVDDDYHERVNAGKMEKNSRPAEGSVSGGRLFVMGWQENQLGVIFRCVTDKAPGIGIS